VNTTQQVGGAVGIAVLATLSTSRTNGLLATGTPPAEALTSGFRLAFWIGAAMLAVAVMLALTVLRRPARSEEPVGEPVTVGAL
jgi:hypothetical protein